MFEVLKSGNVFRVKKRFLVDHPSIPGYSTLYNRYPMEEGHIVIFISLEDGCYGAKKISFLTSLGIMDAFIADEYGEYFKSIVSCEK